MPRSLKRHEKPVSKTDPNRPLTPKERIFVREYQIDLNGTAAAKRAGYSEHSADQMAKALFARAAVRKAVDDALAARSKRLDVTADNVLKELARIAFSDKRNVVTWGEGGITIKESAELSDDDAATVAEVAEEDTKFGTRRKVKVHDKVKALELLGKHLGMFNDKVQISGPNGGPIQNVSMTPNEFATIAKNVADQV